MNLAHVYGTITTMNSYLLTLVLKPGLEEKERKGLLDGLVKKATGDGKVTKEDLWGERELVYPVKKQSKGYFAHFQISADPKAAKGLDKQLKIEENLLRYLLVRV
ncbi:MAG: small subunit ribosomal protein S6 [Microgenomates group bacterium Gr01-1014_7]|nr:MAG: small subunit ribosomal protein S6 [Microgenomates group bacterium Gr01-1014_7]